MQQIIENELIEAALEDLHRDLLEAEEKAILMDAFYESLGYETTEITPIDMQINEYFDQLNNDK